MRFSTYKNLYVLESKNLQRKGGRISMTDMKLSPTPSRGKGQITSSLLWPWQGPANPLGYWDLSFTPNCQTEQFLSLPKRLSDRYWPNIAAFFFHHHSICLNKKSNEKWLPRIYLYCIHPLPLFLDVSLEWFGYMHVTPHSPSLICKS